MHLDEKIAGRRLWRLGPHRERLMFVPAEIRKCTCFLAYDTGEGRQLAGTGFFVSVPSKAHADKIYIYLVTAKHVIKGIESKSVDNGVYIRLNTQEGGYDWIAVDNGLWTFHDDEFVDVAVLPMPAFMLREFDHLSFPIDSSGLNLERIEQAGIGLGDEVVIAGLFVKHSGRKRNVPIIRVGNLAAMPEEPIAVKMWGTLVGIDAYLIEARSTGGLSGSPVFVNMGQFRYHEGKVRTAEQPALLLLGLVHGHWDEKLSADEVAADSPAERERFNMGIGIVIPAQRIGQILYKQELITARGQIDQRLAEDDSPMPDMAMPATDAGEDGEGTAGPMSRPAFEKALRKVSRRVAEPDEGTS